MKIPLIPAPSQALSYNEFYIRLYAVDDRMYVDIVKDDKPIVRGYRVYANMPLIPYAWLAKDGNFKVVSVSNGDLIHWHQFGIDQHLEYIPANDTQ